MFGLSAAFFAASAALAAAAFPSGPPGSAFYTPPSVLPATGEGSIVWMRGFHGGAALASAAANYRVLYEAVSQSGALVAVSGTVAVPRGAPPARGWPLISWAHGTVGNAPDCAPSRGDRPNVEQRMLDGFVRRGYAVAQTDYEGNGTPGIHPYMVGAAAARDVTDMAIAARHVDAQIGRDWVVMGHSEGGAAALATAALGQQLAPALNLLGVVAFAPFAYPEATLQSELHRETPNGGLPILGLLIEGFSTVDPRVVPDQILEPEAVGMLPELQQQCIDVLMRHSDWSSTIPSTIFRPSGQSGVEALYDDLFQNDPAYFAISIPTLLVQGASDTMVIPESTLSIDDHLRRNGTPVSYKAYLGATHGSVLAAAAGDVAAWLGERFSHAR